MGFEEADIRAGLLAGGEVQSAFIVIRPAVEVDAVQYVAYLRTSWRRGYHILQTYKHKNDKVYVGRGLHRLVWLIQEEFRYQGSLVLYRAGCGELQRFVGLQSIDRDFDPGAGVEPLEVVPSKVDWERPAHSPAESEIEGDEPAED